MSYLDEEGKRKKYEEEYDSEKDFRNDIFARN